MMQLRYIIIVLLIGIFNGLLVAQTESDITFNIRDSINKAPLEAVTISVLNTPYGGITNDSGNCTIHAILPNNFTVKYSLIGYASSIKQYMSSEISPEKTIQIFMNILPTVTNDVVIMALRNNSRMENTPANVEVLGLEEVNEENSIMPGNVSGLLGDIAGVQLQRTSSITGSSNIRLEGLDGRYTQILR
ncbi:MAG: carboxypeptidase-like regulatory domain-containing protein, partial [Ignavibacteria bacterium]|nr:carboxypeptidase-like regulatory domain-containing protein [Ignavibacteria bacterium]